MKTGSWYLMVFVLTFLYFYIYAVNYVRGASVPTSSLQSNGFHPPSTVAGYVTEEVQVQKIHLNFCDIADTFFLFSRGFTGKVANLRLVRPCKVPPSLASPCNTIITPGEMSFEPWAHFSFQLKL